MDFMACLRETFKKRASEFGSGEFGLTCSTTQIKTAARGLEFLHAPWVNLHE